jgi:hypothetical protein
MPDTESDQEVSREQAGSLAKRWLWIILSAQFLVLFIPLPLGILFYHFGYGLNFGGFVYTTNWANHWLEIPATILALLLLAMVFGWAFDVYARMAWKRLARAPAGIRKMERWVKAGLFLLVRPHAIGNFFITPLYFLADQYPGSAAAGLSFCSIWLIPPIGLLLAILRIPRIKKES